MGTTINNSSSIQGLSKFRSITLEQLDNVKKKLAGMHGKKWSPNLTGAFFYVLTFATLSIYGGKACRFIEEFPLLMVFLYIFLSIIPLFILRALVIRLLGRDKILHTTELRYIFFESSFLLVWVAVLAICSVVFFNFSSESFLKITVGSALLCIFSIVNLFLVRRKYLLIHAYQHREKIQSKDDFIRYNSFFSLKIKFVIVVVFLLILVGIAFSLINLKNFEWLISNFHVMDHQEAVSSVFKETIFIILVFMGLMSITAVLYSNNIIICFAMLSRVVGDIFDEKFENQLFTLSNDEFGMMGENLNIISDELKEKKKIKSAFGKLVSPRVAEIMLNDKDLYLGGVERQSVVLFSDLRNFTNSSSLLSPTSIISNLNKYFTKMVDLVEGHDGIVDKFMGDGLMALYGYDDYKRGVNDAVRSALEMLQFVRDKSTVKIGIGIHVGNAILGLIGSPQRLDFTAIGSSVNVASRLESATKDHGVDLFLSKDAYDLLEKDLQDLQWIEKSILVKGIDQEISVCGLIIS